MKRAAFARIMDIWVDKDNEAVADALDANSIKKGMTFFKRNFLYDYAIRKIGYLPHRHEHYEMLKDYWRKERRQVAELQ